MKFPRSALLVVLISCTFGCTTHNSKERRREYEALVERVRAKVFGSAIELSSNERETVKFQQPKMQVYRMAGDYADYHFEWVANGTRIIIGGQGRLSALEGSEVKKIKKGDPGYGPEPE